MRTLWILLACVFAVPAALGQDYPSKPVRIIVASAPGGGYDFTGRQVLVAAAWKRPAGA